MRSWFSGKRTIEERLRDERPEPSADLMRSIVTEIRGSAPRRLARTPLRLAVLTSAVVAGLAAIGGLGYAATYTARVVSIVTGAKVSVSHHVVYSSARAQYGTTTTATTTSAATTVKSTTTSATTTTTTTTGAGGEATTSAESGSTGSVSTENPADPGHPVSAIWSADTFTGTSGPVTVTVDPTPPTVANGGTIKNLTTGSVIVSITASTASGAVTTLNAPLDILIANPPSGFVPAYSTNGTDFVAIPQISGPSAMGSLRTAYYVASDGVHILTLHLTIFGVVAKADLTISETGRKLAPAGSGRWGDASLVHAGAPTFTIKSGPTAAGSSVKFTFFVDEQAAVYFHVLSGGKLLLLTGKSKVRTAKIGGPNQRTQHVAVLRPGTIPVTLVLKKTGAKMSIQVSAIDFDGHKVTRIASVK